MPSAQPLDPSNDPYACPTPLMQEYLDRVYGDQAEDRFKRFQKTMYQTQTLHKLGKIKLHKHPEDFLVRTNTTTREFISLFPDRFRFLDESLWIRCACGLTQGNPDECSLCDGMRWRLYPDDLQSHLARNRDLAFSSSR